MAVNVTGLSDTVERECLLYDPFYGDETYVTPLSDKFVFTRKVHRCQICWDEIPANSRVRAKTERNNEERKVATFYFCTQCCYAMADSINGSDDEICRRTSQGVDRAEREHREVAP